MPARREALTAEAASSFRCSARRTTADVAFSELADGENARTVGVEWWRTRGRGDGAPPTGAVVDEAGRELSPAGGR